MILSETTHLKDVNVNEHMVLEGHANKKDSLVRDPEYLTTKFEFNKNWIITYFHRFTWIESVHIAKCIHRKIISKY